MRLMIGMVAVATLSACGRAEPPPQPDARLLAFEGKWSGRGPMVPAPLTPQWQAKLDANLQREKDYGELDSNFRRCLPNGVPAAFTGELDIWVRPNGLNILGGRDNLRVIHLDRNEHTSEKDLKPTYQGESIGHWDGDTLVVDTIGLMRSNEVATGVGNVKLHVVERFSMVDKQLKVETRVEDPYAFTSPWVYTRLLNPAPPQQGPISEIYCVQSLDRSFDAETGEQTLRLGEQAQEKPHSVEEKR